MMAKILITHGVPMDGFRMLKPHRLVVPEPGRAFTMRELLQELYNCDAVVTCGAFNRELIWQCHSAKVLVCYGAGYDSVDLDAASEYGLPVVNVPDTVTEATAQLTMAQILTVTRRIAELDRAIRTQEETRDLFTMGRAMGVMLTDMTLGIVGMGRIGARVAEFGRFIGMRVAYASREIKPFSVAGNARRLPLAELLSRSDVLTLHCPLTPETYRMIGRDELARMKPTAYFINASRGRLVDETALIEALEQGRLAGAALDVYETEPTIAQRLKRLDNVVLTPHIGSNTLRTRNRMAEQCSERILEALAGRRPENLLNVEAWQSQTCDPTQGKTPNR